ncbi:DNA circularization protein [Paraburkholderia bryophila]|uniref:Prophage DNA circulation protein n=1 Tax=Paraburkholderia bryophila TaxID=420952 RepID=A0A7Z0B6I7_9BURK|nr:DNA circularization N-terminal domain-containing protein [Paraburkholderia bryophila]NYH21382.1 prophage DNA circulation protein [Paraburkholderia bryophila]
MSTADVLNVAGSIGGVASAVGSLASLIGFQAGSWLSSLKQASYGGLPFGIESVRTAAGRKQAVHNYPFRDEVWVEDLGKKGRQFEVLGFLVEDDLITKAGPVVAQRDKLLQICETPGNQTLVHPTLGMIKNVACLSVETMERTDLGRVFEIRLTLIVSGDRIFPTSVISTGDASINNASLTGVAALEDFVKSASTTIQAGAAVVQQAVSTVVGWYQLGVTAINDVKRVIGTVSTLFGNFGRLFGGANNGFAGANVQVSPSTTANDLLSSATAARAAVVSAGVALQTAALNPSDSATLGAAAQSFIASVSAAATDPADSVRMISVLAQYSQSAVTTPGQIGAAMSVMQVALAALLRRYALAQLAVVLTTYQPASHDDANTTLASAVDLFDAEITVAGDAGDDNSYQALRTVRQSIVADMTVRGADLAAIATFKFQAALPSLVLANRIYRDPTREPGLVQQIAPRHPAFCPTTFQALAS